MKASHLPLIVATLLLAQPATGPAAQTENGRRPNFLVILADDMGFSDAGCYGGETRTPNLDRLAANGLRFTQFYNTARCWPTRCALMTGYYPQQIRADPNRGLFPTWTRTLPHMLKPLGYRCYHSGKWHVNGSPLAVADAGFDHSYRIEDHNRQFNPTKLTEDDRPLPAIPPGTEYYSATACADHTIGYLKQHATEHKDQPFFAYLAFISPHFPLHAPAEDVARCQGRYDAGWEIVRTERDRRLRTLGISRSPLPAPEQQLRAPSGEPGVEREIDPAEIAYALPWQSLTDAQRLFQSNKMEIHAAMVERIDREIGRVLQQLDQMGALDNTVVFFLSDNGASAEILVRGDGHDRSAPPGSAGSFLCLGPGWSTVANTPFRRHKIWVHEGGISTPLIVHWPRGIAARGELRNDPGHVIDLAPTLLDLAGAPDAPRPTGAPPLPGKSLTPAFAKNDSVQRDCIFFHHQGNRALRAGDWKIVSAKDDADQWALYHLSDDRGETTDLAQKFPERVAQMASRWLALETEFNAQSEVGAPPARPGKRRGKQAAE